MREIKVKSAAMTRIGRHDAGYADLLRECVDQTLRDVEPSRVTRAFLASFAPLELCGIADPARLASETLAACGARGIPLEGPFRTGGEALLRALEYMRDASGDLLVLGCEKMTHVDAGEAAGLLATTVRVNPGGEPFRLGIAVTHCGRARTLCRLEGRLRGSDHDRVILVRRGDGFVALAAPVTGARNRD